MATPKSGLLCIERPAETTPPIEGFDVLIERAVALLVASSTSHTNEEGAQRLQERARYCMIEAAHSPFFGGTKTAVSYEGLDAVRELVFDRVREELAVLGYPMPNHTALSGSP